MANIKAEFQDWSTLSDSIDNEFLDALEPKNLEKANSVLNIDVTKDGEKLNMLSSSCGGVKRKQYQRKDSTSMYCKTPGKLPLKALNLSSQEDQRKRTKSFRFDSKAQSSMSVMMNDDSSYLENQVVCKTKASLFRELTCIVMQSSNFIKTMPPVDFDQLEEKKVYLPFMNHKSANGDKNQKLKTIIFDMDETLIHKLDSSDKCKQADVYVQVPTEDNLEVKEIGFNIRPYTFECLKEANKFFEVVVFTAGTKNYANSILDILDPTGELIQHRLFRDSCVEVKADGSSLFVKDLRIFEGRSLEDIFIVDNAVFSFAYQIDNGIPILPFREDKGDIEFLHLINIMKDISEEKDCRNFIRKAFKISEIMKTDIDSYVHHYEMSDSDNEDFDKDDCLNIIAACQKSLNCGIQSRDSENKFANKKVKKRKRLSFKKVKKAASHYPTNTHNFELNPIHSFAQSQKEISSSSQLCLLEDFPIMHSSSNNIFESDEVSDDLFENIQVPSLTKKRTMNS